jgi:hypothetical protein
MNIITDKQVHQVSGGYINISHEHRLINTRTTETRTIFTMQFDGSTPPEFQQRIDAGESFESMQKDLRMYHVIRMMMKRDNPHLFSD